MYYVSASALKTFSASSLATSAACVVIMEWAAPGTVTEEALACPGRRIPEIPDAASDFLGQHVGGPAKMAGVENEPEHGVKKHYAQ